MSSGTTMIPETNSNFLLNTGGDGSSEARRAKYELIPASLYPWSTGTKPMPSLSLELYSKLNQDKWELHANLILVLTGDVKFKDNLDSVQMGFLLNPNASSTNFDGVSITATNVDPPTFTAKDVWITERPWVKG